MEIKPPNIQIAAPNTTSIKATINQWRTGQVLDATITSRVKEDSFTLKVGATTLQATGKPPAELVATLEAGTKLKLQVVQITPQLTLKVLPNINTNSAATEALKQHLPKQTSLTPLLANLLALSKSPISQLPTSLSNSIEHLLRQLPSAQQMLRGDGDAIKRMLKESGLFLERNISENTPSTSRNLNSDFKANILKVLQQLQNYQQQTKETPQLTTTTQKTSQQLQTLLQPRLPGTQTTLSTPPQTLTKPLALPLDTTSLQQQISNPTLKNAPLQAQARSQPTLNQSLPLAHIVEELSKQVEGAVSRVRVTQLANLPTDLNQPLNLNVELPVRGERGIDIFQLRIEEDDDTKKRENDQKKGMWKVTLAFDFEELGPMYANLSVYEKNVSATIHAEQAETTKLIDKNLTTLSQNLIEAGLTVEKLVCLTGKPIQPSGTRIFQSFLDIKA